MNSISNSSRDTLAKEEEEDTVKEMVTDIQSLGRNLHQQHVQFTPHEESVFNKYQYYHFGMAFTCAGITFVGLFGGLRYHAYRKFLNQAKRPISQYQSLDRPELALKQKVEQQTRQFSIMDHSTESLVHNLVSIFISMLAGSAAGNAYYDHALYLKNVSRLPLQAGQSAFCDSVCPYILQRNFPNDIQSVELEYMHQLQYNCQLRNRYLVQLRRDDPTVDSIPPPGVPLRYANANNNDL